MSLALRIVIGWSVAIVVTIALWNLGFILAARRQRALEARGMAAGGEGGLQPGARPPQPVRAATPARAARITGERPAVARRTGANGRRARAG